MCLYDLNILYHGKHIGYNLDGYDLCILYPLDYFMVNQIP